MSLLSACIQQQASLQGRYLNKHTHFAKAYEALLEPFRGKPVHLVEMGINHGGSLQMWRDYLGKQAHIYGLDNAEHCLYTDDRITCHLIDQSKQADLDKIASLIPQINIFIDDGSHYSRDQIATFETVFQWLMPGGLYIVEDTHTSYRELYDGGYKKPDTFIEYAKHLIDSMYANEHPDIVPNPYSNSIVSITFHYAMVVICKL